MIMKLTEAKFLHNRAVYCNLRIDGEICGGRITYKQYGPAINKKADVRCGKCGSDLSIREVKA